MLRVITRGTRVALAAMAAAACADRSSVTDPATAPSLSAAADRSQGGGQRGDLRAGAVYAMTNQPTGNAIMAFSRASNGSLTPVGIFPTGGLGTGGGTDPLASQGSLVLAGHASDEEQQEDPSSDAGGLLFAANAGSNDISVFRVVSTGLTLASRVSSGGMRPTGLTVHRDLLYVMNAGSGTIDGFRIGKDGSLTAIPGSSLPITGGMAANPSEVAFSPDGRELVVTGKAMNNIDTYLVGRNGVPSGPHANHSNGASPFGFAFANREHFVVSEPMGSASSYRLSRDGTVGLVSGSVPDFQAAPCWLVTTSNGKYAFAANAASKSISSYRVSPNGTLALLQSVAGATDPAGAALDLALSRGSRYLYSLNDVSGTIDGFRVSGDGTLMRLGMVGGLPPYAQGIAAR